MVFTQTQIHLDHHARYVDIPIHHCVSTAKRCPESTERTSSFHFSYETNVLVRDGRILKKKAIGYFNCHSHHCSPHAAKALCCVNGTIVDCTVHFLRTICKGNFRQNENIEKQLNKQETPQARCHVTVIHRYFLISRSPH